LIISETVDLDLAGMDGPAKAAVVVDRAVLGRACGELGFDPDDGERVRDLAAVAVTRLAWRDGPVEDWHRFRCIDNTEIMRANAATTRLVREVLIDQLHPQGDLFGQVSRVLTDPYRVLPDGRRLAQLAPSTAELARYQTHADKYCAVWTNTAASTGPAEVLTLLACRGAIFNWRWWLSTGWPHVVDEFVRRLDEPERWRNAWEVNNRRRLGDPPDGLTSTELGRLLLAGPDLMTPAMVTYCLRAGVRALLPHHCGLPPVRYHLLPTGYLDLIEDASLRRSWVV
jgi:hypothetical protein